ncbi:MAG: hypothetical protein ACYS4W_11200 [Planctomycetota bacterium]|jgi:hypothetical protein
MISDTDLTKAEVVLPEEEAVMARSGLRLFKRSILFCVLLAANVIMWSVVYDLWGGRSPRVKQLLAFGESPVSGIMYSDDSPCAIVRDEVVEEGDTVGGYRVVKIYRHKVELEKDGRILTRQVD